MLLFCFCLLEFPENLAYSNGGVIGSYAISHFCFEELPVHWYPACFVDWLWIWLQNMNSCTSLLSTTILYIHTLFWMHLHCCNHVTRDSSHTAGIEVGGAFGDANWTSSLCPNSPPFFSSAITHNGQASRRFQGPPAGLWFWYGILCSGMYRAWNFHTCPAFFNVWFCSLTLNQVTKPTVEVLSKAGVEVTVGKLYSSCFPGPMRNQKANWTLSQP